MREMQFSQRDFIRFFLILSVIPTGLWVHLDLIGLKALPFILSFILLEFAPASLWNDTFSKDEPLPKLTFFNALIGIIILVPVTAYMLLTWNQEVPIGGDFSYQFSVSRAFMEFFLRQGCVKLGLALLFLFGLGLVLKRVGRVPRFSFLILVLLLYGASFKLNFAREMLGRYPDFYYFLAVPLNMLSAVMHWDSPMNANRLTTFFNFVIWLWILRPVFIRRWPDLQILPFGLFFVWQKQILWFGTTTYLEPWSIIFLVLAFESLVSLPLERKWISLVWIGFSSITKEPGIVLLPFFTAILGWFYYQQRKINLTNVLSIFGVTFFSGVGFLVFYFHKKAVGGVRQYVLRPLEQVFTIEPWKELGLQLHFQLGTSGVILCLLVLVLGGWLCFKSNARKQTRALIIFCLLCAGFMLGFFFVDAAAEWFTGYSRYHVYVIVAFTCIILPISYELMAQKQTKLMRLLIIVCGTLNLWMTAPLIQSTQLPDDVMNDMEFFGMPCYFPIKRLVERYLEETKPAAPPEIALMAFRCELSPALAEYPNLMERVRAHVENGSVTDTVCKCDDKNAAVFAGFQPASQVALYNSNSFYGKQYAEYQKLVPQSAKECVRQLEESCKKVLVEPSARGEIWGALGFN